MPAAHSPRWGSPRGPELAPGEPGLWAVEAPGDPPAKDSVFHEPGSVVLPDDTPPMSGGSSFSRKPDPAQTKLDLCGPGLNCAGYAPGGRKQIPDGRRPRRSVRRPR